MERCPLVRLGPRGRSAGWCCNHHDARRTALFNFLSLSGLLGLWGRSAAHAIDPALVAAADLARVLPGYLELPGWARRGRQSWFDSGHRLVVRLWEPTAGGVFEPVSLHARRIGPDAAQDKARFPRGCSAAGLMLALGPEPFADCDAPEPDGPRCLTIVEGVPDFLLWATRPAAVRGGLLGSVTAAVAPGLFAGLPDGCRVVLRHHGDDGGELHRVGLRRLAAGGDLAPVASRMG